MLIGFTGRMHSGKTTAAMHLVRSHGFTRHRFAGPLKAMLHAIGLTERHTDGDLKEEPCDLLDGKTPRWAMQSLGTEWGRMLITPNLWVNAWLATKPEGNVVVDDVRFDNEAAMIRSAGGIVVRIVRPGQEGGGVKHASEEWRGEADLTIYNGTTVSQFERHLDAAMGLHEVL